MQSPDRTNYLPGDAHQRFEVLTANNIADFNHNNNNKNSVEHIPHAQPRSCMLYMNRGCTINNFQFCRKRRAPAVVVILHCVYFNLPIRDTLNIASVHACASVQNEYGVCICK